MVTELTSELAVEKDLSQILVNKYFFLAALSVLMWDHLTTLPDEVQTVWKRKKGLPMYMFLLLRYYALLAMIVVAYGYFSPTMTGEHVYAFYNQNRAILAGFLVVIAIQTAVGFWIWTFPGSGAAPDPINNEAFHFCVFLPPKRAGSLSPIFVLFDLAFETLIFVLTMARTLYLYKTYPVVGPRRNTLMQCFIRDGAVYYFAIFSFNLMWSVMILHAPTGLRAIAAIPTSAFSATLISRITFNIRIEAMGTTNVFERTENGIPLSDLSWRKQISPRGTNGSRSTDWSESV
ncbi:uncharacterized protein STEHIDRAFT_153048 [Stereum hirsutum FP-91666 SS1]|uniref:uncharacterized protein n=1 Tax=Stereum hirsutum (strain FP-91666) TaxID=721885 RepID=UPI000440F0ED|nr:uncharacterized protein STEHIDRAFT_153048 [Stereum hirsutum FP-91666 SS1]EIM91402.1 hypothetical protein STEHIDRAFT_153048 [Stereum hirsutum FP-91666 SS1]